MGKQIDKRTVVMESESGHRFRGYIGKREREGVEAASIRGKDPWHVVGYETWKVVLQSLVQLRYGLQNHF